MVETRTQALTDPTEPAIPVRVRSASYFTPPIDIYETDDRDMAQLNSGTEELRRHLYADIDSKQSVKPSPNGQLLPRTPSDSGPTSNGRSPESRVGMEHASGWKPSES